MKQLIILFILLLSSLQMSASIQIGTQKQYDHVVEIYQNLLNKGVNEHAAFELVNQKIAEKGWTGYATGDNKKYDNVNKFTDHLIEWHGRMYPYSLKATTFEEFWDGIQVLSNYRYNPFPKKYKKHLLKIRKGVLKRINHYRKSQNLPPLN